MATITVTNLYDSGAGSLRDAISLANPAGGDTIDFAPNLAGGTLLLTSGELAITKSLTIDGDIDNNGTADITISGDHASRVFEVTGGPAIVATLDGLVIRDGSAGVGNSGGGIEVGSTDGVFLNNSQVINNQASDGGGIHGGIASEIVLTNASVCGNTGDGSGGGIYAGTAATLTLTNATISGNYSHDNGGGISAGYASSAMLTNATLSGNTSGDHGGAIFGDGSQIRLYDSTLTGNYAGTAGGGIYDAHHVGGGPLVLLSNSIVAGNAAAASAPDLDAGGSQLFIHGHNILGSAPANATVESFGTYTTINGADQAALQTVFAHVGYDPNTGVLSGVLAGNGGPLETVAINPSGIAHDTGDNAALRPDFFDLNHNNNTAEPLPVDARDFARVSGSNVDVGAFEQQPAAAFVVTTLADDTYDGGTLAQEMADGGGLSLREALGLANQDPTTADTITFAPGLTGGSTHGVDDGVLVLANGRLTINGNVTIEGDVNGDGAPDITIDAHGASRDFVIKGGTVSLDGLTITGGYALLDGGGVSIRSGSYGPSYVTISHSVITNNQAGYGGGIFVDSDDALLLKNSVVSGNYAYYGGGGIANRGALAVLDSTVSGNSAYYSGGGIANQGLLVVVNATLANNQVISPTGNFFYVSGGGGLYNDGLAALTNTTISGNKGGYGGGGIYNSGSLLLTNVTIANNSAYNGGGLYSAACGCGDATLFDSTITGNNADQFGGGIYNANGSVTLTNTIVAGNRAGYQGSDIANGYGITSYSGVNLFSQTGTGRSGIDIVQPALTQVFAHLTTVDPDGVPNSGDEFQAGTLANNGGPVQTVAIKKGGGAHDTGSTADLPPDIFDLNNNNDVAEPLPVDARGAPRVFGPAVDIGAVEIQAPVVTISGLTGGNAVEHAPVTATIDDNGTIINSAVYTWKADGTTVQSGSSNTYTPTENDEGKALTVDVSFTDPNDASITEQASQSAGIVQEDPNENASIAFSGLVNGHPQEGRSLTAIVTESDAPASGISYTWKVDGTIVQTGVDGAGNSYKPTHADDGKTITVAVTFTDSHGFAEHGNATAGVVSALVHVSAGDFDTDGDKNGDLLWQNADGTVVTWDMNGAQIESQTTLGQLPANWHLAGVGHFNPGPSGGGAFGNTDALFHSDAGGVVLWQVSNNHVVLDQLVGQVPTNWHIVGLGDFNGDGATDVAWQSDAGQMLMWEMNGSHVIVDQAIGQAPAGGHAVAVADFNNDGKADILFQTDSGNIVMWEMNGTQIIANQTVGQIPSNWHFATTGDFNGDGKADVLFISDAGQVLAWEMNGTQIIANQLVGQVPTNWQVSGTADVNGDGRSDVIFTSDAGAHQVWEMNGTNVILDQPLGAGSPPASPPQHASAASAASSASFASDALSSLTNHDQHFLV